MQLCNLFGEVRSELDAGFGLTSMNSLNAFEPQKYWIAFGLRPLTCRLLALPGTCSWHRQIAEIVLIVASNVFLAYLAGCSPNTVLPQTNSRFCKWVFVDRPRRPSADARAK